VRKRSGNAKTERLEQIPQCPVGDFLPVLNARQMTGRVGRCQQARICLFNLKNEVALHFQECGCECDCGVNAADDGLQE
jgi:hypothetical protein